MCYKALLSGGMGFVFVAFVCLQGQRVPLPTAHMQCVSVLTYFLGFGVVVWCGVVWCGVVWCGVVWCGVVWCGVVWCGVEWCAEGCYQKAMAGMSCTQENAKRVALIRDLSLTICPVCWVPPALPWAGSCRSHAGPPQLHVACLLDVVGRVRWCMRGGGGGLAVVLAHAPDWLLWAPFGGCTYAVPSPFLCGGSLHPHAMVPQAPGLAAGCGTSLCTPPYGCALWAAASPFVHHRPAVGIAHCRLILFTILMLWAVGSGVSCSRLHRRGQWAVVAPCVHSPTAVGSGLWRLLLYTASLLWAVGSVHPSAKCCTTMGSVNQV